MTGFVDPAFRHIKASEPCFQIWRIEKMEVRPISREQYGSFYDGDAYIIYSATGSKNGRMEMHIHFWLGSNSTPDEYTTAAFKTVELDEYLGGSPIQHRETQGNESARFKAYFKNGIRFLKGGVVTGLRHVTNELTTRLFLVKGRRSPVLTEQESVSWKHFNSGDCFILETNSRVFVWIGSQANTMEKLQSAKVAMQLRDEHPERSIVFVDEGEEEKLYPDDKADFNNHLPLWEMSVQPAVPDSDVVAEKARNIIKLYRCSDESGTCKVTHEKDGPLKQSDLVSADSFIIDNGVNGIWVWVGKKATAQERGQAMSNALGFVTKKNYPKETQVTRVIDGAEPTEFKMLFPSWKDSNSSVGLGRQYSLSRIAPTVNTKFDAKVLHDTPSLAADTQLVDDGTGSLTVWRLHDKELELVPQEHFGVFFDGDCYLLHYAYSVRGKENHILYYWLGTHSAQDEKGTIAWHTIKKDDELGGAAVQVRVVQGKEPPHFLTIFSGKMIIFNGGYASEFDGEGAEDVGIPTEFLIQVRGGDKHNTRAIQVEKRAASLNTNDVFVLATGPYAYVWCGKGSTGDERERAKVIAAQWAPNAEVVVVSEGQEKEAFWKSFPHGKEAYANDERLRDSELRVPARLFQCSNATGVFKAEEIRDFAQVDLVPDDVMVLDAGKAIFIWIGKGANKEERLSAPQLVQDYLHSDPGGRDLDTPMIQIQQGYEPPNFTGFFGAWDPTIWENNDYDSVRSQLEAVRIIEAPSSTEKKEVTKYSIEVLTETDPDKLPDDVDPLSKELHLTDEDFHTLFRMEWEAFNALPQWRRNDLKKKAKIF